MNIATFNAHVRRFIELILLKQLDDAREVLHKHPELKENRNSSRETPLHWLAIENEIEGVRMLLDAGADANSVAHDENSVLADAAALGCVKICELLLAAGADLAHRTSFQETALHRAAGHSPDPDVLDLLIRAGAEIEARNHLEQTPLFEAAFLSNDAAVVRLCELLARADARNGFGETPLHEAATHAGQVAVSDALVQRGAEINAIDTIGDTPLLNAVRANNVVTARRLIELNASRSVGDPPRAVSDALRSDAPPELVALVRNGDHRSTARA